MKKKHEVIEFFVILISVFILLCIVVGFLAFGKLIKNIKESYKPENKCKEAYRCELNDDGTYTCYYSVIDGERNIICEEHYLQRDQFANSVLIEKFENQDFVIKEIPIDSENGYYILEYDKIDKNKKLYYKINEYFELFMLYDDYLYINNKTFSVSPENKIKIFVYNNYLLYFNDYSFTNGIRNVVLIKDNSEKRFLLSYLEEENMFINKIYEDNYKINIELIKSINNNQYFDENYKNDICSITDDILISKTLEFNNTNALYLEAYDKNILMKEEFIKINNLCGEKNGNKE